MKKVYKSERAAKRAAKKSGGRVVRRDRFGRINKRGRNWTVSKRRTKRPPKRPPKRPVTEFHIKIDYTKGQALKGGKHPIMIDMIIRSKSPMTKGQAKAYIENAASGQPLPKGVKIDAINWRRKEGPETKRTSGGLKDLENLGAAIYSAESFRIEEEE